MSEEVGTAYIRVDYRIDFETLLEVRKFAIREASSLETVISAEGLVAEAEAIESFLLGK